MSAESYPANMHTEIRRSADADLTQQLGRDALSLLQAEETADRQAIMQADIQVIHERYPALKQPNEGYLLNIGEATFPILNYANEPLEQGDLTVAAEAFESITATVGEENVQRINAKFAVVDAADMAQVDAGGNAVAHADRDSGIIAISALVFKSSKSGLKDVAIKDYQRFLGEDVSLPKIVLTHEYGHQVEFAATRDQVLAGVKDPRLVNDILPAGSMLDPPFRSSQAIDISDHPIIAFQAGEYITSSGREAYGDAAQIEPLTSYSRKAPGEYVAEAFTLHALGGSIGQPLQDAINVTLDTRLGGEPRPATAVQPTVVEKMF